MSSSPAPGLARPVARRRNTSFWRWANPGPVRAPFTPFCGSWGNNSGEQGNKWGNSVNFTPEEGDSIWQYLVRRSGRETGFRTCHGGWSRNPGSLLNETDYVHFIKYKYGLVSELENMKVNFSDLVFFENLNCKEKKILCKTLAKIFAKRFLKSESLIS
jgi:hypothetical protein